ncbi:hypothetical protein MKQ70_26025 [Chitinophaga sedimenti]|uniref:alpha/beta hydrolase family protein n=1 Tax=Chitinophaga sedimenti TaxID=2033606 RepID=UPI002004BA52|nr:hypothetical protein [Chitinophaga sedimenti]MCK7558271.1 hypothetical protein [Chitinophaga sedimenti]
MALLNNKGKVIRELGDSRTAAFDEYLLAPTELRTYTTRDGLTLPITIMWPLHMEAGKKYPVLINVYGGPDAGSIYDTWKPSLMPQWYAKEGIIRW